jgi:hypothetical protein
MHGERGILRLLVLLGAVGCGLVSRDVTAVSFDLPAKSYSFDTNDSMWKLPVGSFPSVPCGSGQLITDCCNPPAPIPTPDCGITPLVCVNALCTLTFPVSVVQNVNLKDEVPQLKNVNSQYLINVSISQIRYSVANSLNVDLPPVELYIAPDGVTSPLDPSAQKFGTVPSLHAMTGGDDMVILEPGSEVVFANYAHEFGTPFNFIAAATIVVASGSPIPHGKVAITITAQVTASL